MQRKGPPRRQRSEVFSSRLDPQLRAQLEAAAKVSGRNLTLELDARLRESFKQDTDDNRDRALRAIRHIVAETANAVTGVRSRDGKPVGDWRSNPFFYRAFTLALRSILDFLAPPGKIQPPYDLKNENNWRGLPPSIRDSYATPEARADATAAIVLYALQNDEPLPSHHKEWAKTRGRYAAIVERQHYAMAAARDDLKIQPVEEKP